jgi:hypothetical protein
MDVMCHEAMIHRVPVHIPVFLMLRLMVSICFHYDCSGLVRFYGSTAGRLTTIWVSDNRRIAGVVMRYTSGQSLPKELIEVDEKLVRAP